MAVPDVLASVTCSKTGHPGVARFVAENGGWCLKAASRQRPGSVLPPAPGSDLRGSISLDPAYPGCPTCGSDTMVRCGQCTKLSCWDNSWQIHTCPHCNDSGPVNGRITEISTLGGG